VRIRGGLEPVNISYGPEGMVTYTDALGQSSTALFNAFGQVSRVHDPLGRIVANRFDENHNLDLTRLPGNLSIDYTFTPQGYLTGRVDSASEEMQMSCVATSGTVFIESQPKSVSQSVRLQGLTDELGVLRIGREITSLVPKLRLGNASPRRAQAGAWARECADVILRPILTLYRYLGSPLSDRDPFLDLVQYAD
jgi:YD repeat-containing protein